VGKEKRHTATLKQEKTPSSLDAIIEESRALRRQMADDLGKAARKLKRMSRHVGLSRRSTDSDE
jgi:hypothetical protein